MSSTNKTTNYQLSQFVGTDIPSILNDYNGDMRKIDSAIHDASVAGGDNASAIAELQSSTARMNTEIGGINSTVNTLSGKVLGIESVIPATASADNKLLTAQELPEIPSITELEEEVSDIGADVKAIQLCVPADASESNKFATMDDVSNKGRRIYIEYPANSTLAEILVLIKNKIAELGGGIGQSPFVVSMALSLGSITGIPIGIMLRGTHHGDFIGSLVVPNGVYTLQINYAYADSALLAYQTAESFTVTDVLNNVATSADHVQLYYFVDDKLGVD